MNRGCSSDALAKEKVLEIKDKIMKTATITDDILIPIQTPFSVYSIMAFFLLSSLLFVLSPFKPSARREGPSRN
jgi:hypothetical protein